MKCTVSVILLALVAVLAAAAPSIKVGGVLSRALLQRTTAAVAAGVGLWLPLATAPLPASAFGPVDVQLTMTGYKPVELCNGKKPIMPGQKAAEGLFPVCIEVEAEVVNPKNDALKDVSVYGFIKDDQGNSVLPNNPDFKVCTTPIWQRVKCLERSIHARHTCSFPWASPSSHIHARHTQSDGGQYAMIKTVPPGKSVQSFQFVAAVSADPKAGPLPQVHS